MNTALATTDGIAEFKSGVDALLEKRDYFIKRILPKFVESRDYYTIKGRKSLGKSGAEKLAAIYSLVATFEKDNETLGTFSGIEGLVAYVCNLARNGYVVGQGRGAAMLENHENDVNKTVKMAQKSAFIDAVIRATGLSDIFTSDLEDMPHDRIYPDVVEKPDEMIEDEQNFFPKDRTEAEGNPITTKQKNLLTSLIFERIGSPSERERWLSEIETCSKFDASEMISSFLIST